MDGLWAPLAGDLGFHRSFPSCVGKLHSADRTRSETFPAHRAAQQAGRQEADVPLVAQPRALPAGEQHHGGAPAPGRPAEAAAGPAPAVSQSVGLSVSQSVNQCARSAGRGSAQLCSTAACKTGEDESFVCTLKGDLTSAYTSHGAVDEPNSRPCALLLLSSEIPPVRLCRLGPCTHRVRGAVASLW